MLAQNSNKPKIEYRQTFPTIEEFKEMLYSFFKESETYEESGAMTIDDGNEDTDLFYRILGDDVVIWYQELQVYVDQDIFVYPVETKDPLYLFKFVVDQNQDLTSIDEEGVFKNNDLVLCNSLGSHTLTLPAGYNGKILQMIVTHRFLSEYVPQDYLQHQVIEAVVQKKQKDILVIEHPPQYLQTELLKMVGQLKGKPGGMPNKLKLLQLTASFIDAFFRIYLGEIPRGTHLSDHEFKAFVNQYFADHIYENFTGIETLAAKLHVSPSTFKRRFSICFETSPLQYFRKQQMQIAKTQLARYKSIDEVAFKFGFSSTSNFIRCFKKHQQCTPGSLLGFRISGQNTGFQSLRS